MKSNGHPVYRVPSTHDLSQIIAGKCILTGVRMRPAGMCVPTRGLANRVTASVSPLRESARFLSGLGDAGESANGRVCLPESAAPSEAGRQDGVNCELCGRKTVGCVTMCVPWGTAAAEECASRSSNAVRSRSASRDGGPLCAHSFSLDAPFTYF